MAPKFSWALHSPAPTFMRRGFAAGYVDGNKGSVTQQKALIDNISSNIRVRLDHGSKPSKALRIQKPKGTQKMRLYIGDSSNYENVLSQGPTAYLRKTVTIRLEPNTCTQPDIQHNALAENMETYLVSSMDKVHPTKFILLVQELERYRLVGKDTLKAFCVAFGKCCNMVPFTDFVRLLVYLRNSYELVTETTGNRFREVLQTHLLKSIAIDGETLCTLLRLYSCDLTKLGAFKYDDIIPFELSITVLKCLPTLSSGQVCDVVRSALRINGLLSEKYTLFWQILLQNVESCAHKLHEDLRASLLRSLDRSSFLPCIYSGYSRIASADYTHGSYSSTTNKHIPTFTGPNTLDNNTSSSQEDALTTIECLEDLCKLANGPVQEAEVKKYEQTKEALTSQPIENGSPWNPDDERYYRRSKTRDNRIKNVLAIARLTKKMESNSAGLTTAFINYDRITNNFNLQKPLWKLRDSNIKAILHRVNKTSIVRLFKQIAKYNDNTFTPNVLLNPWLYESNSKNNDYVNSLVGATCLRLPEFYIEDMCGILQAAGYLWQNGMATNENITDLYASFLPALRRKIINLELEPYAGIMFVQALIKYTAHNNILCSLPGCTKRKRKISKFKVFDFSNNDASYSSKLMTGIAVMENHLPFHKKAVLLIKLLKNIRTKARKRHFDKALSLTDALLKLAVGYSSVSRMPGDTFVVVKKTRKQGEKYKIMESSIFKEVSNIVVSMTGSLSLSQLTFMASMFTYIPMHDLKLYLALSERLRDLYTGESTSNQPSTLTVLSTVIFLRSLSKIFCWQPACDPRIENTEQSRQYIQEGSENPGYVDLKYLVLRDFSFLLKYLKMNIDRWFSERTDNEIKRIKKHVQQSFLAIDSQFSPKQDINLSAISAEAQVVSGLRNELNSIAKHICRDHTTRPAQ